MPVVDMSVEELKQYQGMNPKLADLDEYWAKALDEMNAADPQVSIVKADFWTPAVECYNMYFTGVNGAKIYVKHLRPKNITGKIPAVLKFHGYSCNSGAWYTHLGYAASGIAVFAMDVRGQGGKSQDVGGVCGNTQHGHIIRGLDEKDPQNYYSGIFSLIQQSWRKL